MVVTRSMSGTTKKTTERTNSVTSIMKVTKKKSGTTKKTGTKNAVTANKEASEEFFTRKETRMDRALFCYMDERCQEYRKKNSNAPLSWEVGRAIQKEFHIMSAEEKAPYVDMARKKEVEEHENYKEHRKLDYGE